MSGHFVAYTYEKHLEHITERTRLLFEERFKGYLDIGLTEEIYAHRFADYAERMRQF